MKVVFSQDNFIYGISKSPTIGRGFPRLDGVDLYRDLGYMSAGYDTITASASVINSTVNWMVVDNETAYQTSYLYMIEKGKVHYWNLDNNNLTKTENIGSNYGRGGACLYNDYLWIGSQLATNSIGKWGPLSGSETWSTNGVEQSDYYEMIKFKDGLYGTGGAYIFSTTTTTTFDNHALKLEDKMTAVSLAPYGEFLAIGAIRGERFPSAALGEGEGLLKSRLYFWDTISSSWDKDRSTEISGRILKVLNNKGVLYVVMEDNNHRFSINYFDGNTIKFLREIVVNDDDLQRPGQDAYDIKGEMLYIGTGCGAKGSLTSRVWTYGQEKGMPTGLSTPYYGFGQSTTSTSSQVTSLKWGKPDQLFVASVKGNGTKEVKIFKEANGYGQYTIETPEIFHPDGIKQKLKSIKIITKPLISGDQLDIRRKIDNGSWESSTWQTFSYSNNGALTELLIDEGFEFSTLQLKLFQGAGDNIRIKSIIIETEDAEPI